MSPPGFDAVLTATLADRRLSGGERDAVRAVLADLPLDDYRRAVLRHRVFELARQELITEDSRMVLGWVEDVIKALVAPASRPPAVHSEAHFSPGDDCVARIVQLFRDARSSAEVCVFTITDDRLADALLDAHRRGLAVRVITDNDKAHDLGSDIGRIEAAGVPVRIDRTPFHMHHKFAIFDGRRLLNGSYNWTRGAARDNLENVVVTDDPALVARFTATFQALWAQLA